MNHIKACFFDIDGTLVSFQTHRIPQSTKKALALLRQKGIKLFIATGRHKSFIDNLEGEYFDAYITINGQLCMNEKEIFFQRSLLKEDVDSVIDYLSQTDYACLFVGEKEYFMNRQNESSLSAMKMLNFPPVHTDSIEKAKNMKIYQLVSFVNRDQEADFMKALPHSDFTRWHESFIDILPLGGGKQIGIDHILSYYNLDLSETISFGDGENDISMLKYTPNSVAMGNANDKVKSAATYVTDTVDNDGILKALQHFKLI